LVPETDVRAVLSTQLDDTIRLLRGVSEQTGNTRHAPYTWSVKQVVGHLTDAEREFGHRAFRFARNDPTPLPGFDENVYVGNAPFDSCPIADLAAAWEFARRGNLLLFRHIPDEAWSRCGMASGNIVTVRALAFIIAGHARHHLNILRKRLAGSLP
jgi:hypothetical protein